ncbi:hypothetical protein GCM10022252_06980 [Streptosporangium oxazolinicum]|uniref:Uncharacterized protein n=1 Tax=Streptosporangium oxazolinicum TaxID=909287 RepID=A0ABP8ADB0_9ACTN
MIAYGQRIVVSNVPHGSVNSATSGTGTEGVPDEVEGDVASDEPPAVGESFPADVVITNAATLARITTPRKAMSQRTFRTLPFL